MERERFEIKKVQSLLGSITTLSSLDSILKTCGYILAPEYFNIDCKSKYKSCELLYKDTYGMCGEYLIVEFSGIEFNGEKSKIKITGLSQ